MSSPFDRMTFGEMFAAAEVCAEAASKIVQPMAEGEGMRRYQLRNATATLLAGALQVEPTAADFERCAEIMRKANGL